MISLYRLYSSYDKRMLLQKYFADSKIPVLIVANKSDLSEVKQGYLLQPTAFCSKYKLMPPQPYSISRTVRREIFVKLATMAAFP